jgi:hypothetical protein
MRHLPVLAPQFRDLIRLLGRGAGILAALRKMERTQLPFGRRIIARGRQRGACLQPRHASEEERRNGERFRAPQATLAERPRRWSSWRRDTRPPAHHFPSSLAVRFASRRTGSTIASSRLARDSRR